MLSTIDKIELIKKSKYIQLFYENEKKIELDNIKFKIKNKYDNYSWLISLEHDIVDILTRINDKLINYDNNIKCQRRYLENNNIIVKIKTVKDKIVLDTDINILDDNIHDINLEGSIYLDQIWLYNGCYNYKWKLSKLRSL